ncbi:MAG: polysaccharide deacetylase family protein [Acidobacteriota bacterium]
MKKLFIAFISLSLLIPGCTSARREPQSPQMSRCMEALNDIPTMAAVLRVKSEEDESASLEGMQIALTINQMMLASGEPEKGIDSWCEKENSVENFEKLLDALRQHSMPPVVAFISGHYADIRLLRRWVSAGQMVGNLTFSRRRIKNNAPQSFIEDIARGEQFLAPLKKERPEMKKYFRYPLLKTSRDPATHDQIEAYLKANGYINVPATIEAPTDSFNEIYCAALARGDTTCANLTKEYFKKLLLDSTLKARAIARRRAGGEVKHILMLKAGQFLCDSLGEILAWYRSLGVKFISLDEALSDPVYSTVNEKGKLLARVILSETKRKQLARLKRDAD